MVGYIIFSLVGLAILAGCVGAGIVCRAWWNAVGIAVTWTLFLAFVYYLIVASQSGASDAYDYAFLLTFFIDPLKYLLPGVAVIAAVTSLGSTFIRRRRASKNAT